MLLYSKSIQSIELVLEQFLFVRIGEIESCLSSPGAFLHTVRYGPVEHLSYNGMVHACDGQNAPVHVPTGMVLQ